MAITKRVRVSFDLKAVFTTEDVDHATGSLVDLANDYAEGSKLVGRQLAVLKAALEGGVDEALTLALKRTLKDTLVEAFDDDEFATSNFRFEVKR